MAKKKGAVFLKKPCFKPVKREAEDADVPTLGTGVWGLKEMLLSLDVGSF